MNPRQGTEVLLDTAGSPFAGAAQLQSVVARIASVQESIQDVLTGLAQLAAGGEDRVARVSSMLGDGDCAQRDLAAAHRQIEEKLNALIGVVDCLVRGNQGLPR